MSTLPIITIQDLTKKYNRSQAHSALCALKCVNLTIYKQEIFGIIGESGSGKTTLLRCLTGLDKPTEGTITYADPVCPFGIIFQHFNLFSSKTVFENVLFPLTLKRYDRSIDNVKKAEKLIELVGLSDKRNCYPAELSGGQKQRAAIARALATNPQVLFCDEATSALDPLATRSILNLLVELNQKLGLTIVLITHQMEVIKQICGRAAFLDQGEIVEVAPVADLFCTPQKLRTKEFLARDIPAHLLQTELIRLSFRGEEAKKPIISELLMNHQVSVNILHGGIDCLRQGVIGNLLIEMTGEADEKHKALQFLREKGVFFEVIQP